MLGDARVTAAHGQSGREKEKERKGKARASAAKGKGHERLICDLRQALQGLHVSYEHPEPQIRAQG